MNRRPTNPFEMLSPMMVGAMTVLVAATALILSYNAGNSLPFVPTYDISVEVPDAQELVDNNEVLIGGRRVGVIGSIEPQLTEEGRPYARLNLRLEQDLGGQVLDDATVRVRSRSLLGAKYLELEPGGTGEPLESGAILPLTQARENVEVDELVDEFDPRTRRNLAVVLGGLGTGFASRGLDFNTAVESFRPIAENARLVLGDIVAPNTRFSRLLSAYAATAAELGAAPEDLGGIVRDGGITLRALSDAGGTLARTLEQAPPTLDAGSAALGVLTPVLAKGRRITAQVAPAARMLPDAADRLAAAAVAGTPALRRARILGPKLEGAFSELEGLAAREPSVKALDSLAGVLPELRPAVEHLAPYQTVCNYLGIAGRNLASTASEGNASGNWLRFNAILQPLEMLHAGSAAPRLHFNPYPNGAAPGQPRECEAGRETYLPGQVIGNVPGNQGLATEATTPASVEAVTD